MFIGNKEVRTKDLENGKVLVIVLEDKSEIEINKELYDIIVTEKVGDGTIMDNINNYFARKFVAELAYFDLEFYMVANIAQSMGVLVHNLREELLRKTFSCQGGDTISLKKLLKEDE